MTLMTSILCIDCYCEFHKWSVYRTCNSASSPSCEQDSVGVVPRKPLSVTSSTVSPMDKTRVAFMKDTTIYESNSSERSQRKTFSSMSEWEKGNYVTNYCSGQELHTRKYVCLQLPVTGKNCPASFHKNIVFIYLFIYFFLNFFYSYLVNVFSRSTQHWDYLVALTRPFQKPKG